MLKYLIESGILSIIQSLGIIIASGVAIWGINSWRRQAKWKRKYELAEEVLASFYESHHSIRLIRSPIERMDEGASRQKKPGESAKETDVLNAAFVSRERFENNRKPLERLHALKYRFIALYGLEFEKHFDIFAQIMNDIFFAADDIAMVKLGKYGDDRDLIKEINIESRAILYRKIKVDDEIEKKLKVSIGIIEKKCRSIIGNN